MRTRAEVIEEGVKFSRGYCIDVLNLKPLKLMERKCFHANVKI